MKWFLIVLALLAVGAVFLFNRLVGLRNRAQGAWSDIDVQLKRRHDLVGNLVDTVKGYVTHERETLEEVVRQRGLTESARAAGNRSEAGAASAQLGGGLGKLFALSEAYPDLKSSDRFLDLQRELANLENDLQNARRYYNAVVRDFNTRIQSVPDLLIARGLGFHEMDFFQLDHPGEAAVPRADFGGSGS